MIYLCLGRREQGKTTLALYLTRDAPLFVAFDPRGLLPTGDRLRTTDRYQDVFDHAWDRKAGHIVVTPDRHKQLAFEKLCECVEEWVREPGAPPVAFVVDELRQLTVDPAPESFDWLMRCATRAQIKIAMTAHRPVDVPTDIRAIADVWYFFQTTQENDLRLIGERCPDAVVDRVQRLPPRHFIRWDDTCAQWTLFQDPSVWHLTLAAPSATLARESDNLPAGDHPTKGLF